MNRLFPVWLMNSLVGLDRRLKPVLLLAVDALALVFAAWAAYSLRFGGPFFPNFGQWMLMLSAPVLAMPVFLKLGLYRSVIRYLGEQALWSIVKGMSLGALLWTGLAFMTQMTGAQGVPRSVSLLYWLFGTALVGGTRFGARWVLWAPLRKRFNGRQVLLFGAGNAGRQLAASLRKGRELFPAGFVDDDTSLRGKEVDGFRVYSREDLATTIERFDIHDVIVCLPSTSGAKRRDAVDFLESHNVKVRILPAMTDIADGKHLVNMLREIDIGDLLGRDPVEPDAVLLKRCVKEKTVMVTGAGGSIGSELCRQIASIGPKRLVLLEKNEHALYEINRTLQEAFNCEVTAKLGSALDRRLLKDLLAEQGVQTLYHAAAHKHVPLVETNAREGARNNVWGTFAVAEAAFENKVEHFVLISTDKAVRPSSVMGATKRWAELIVQEFARQAAEKETGQKFCSVRFGNVLGSSGSVIPLFKEQITKGGPVTVTHEEVKRYFMSIHEAVELVIQAGSLAEGGEVFLLDMREPVKILEMARKMIRLAGHSVRDEFNPNGDIEIKIIGLRPGEKLQEELLFDGNNAVGTPHPRILNAREHVSGKIGIAQWLETLNEALKGGNEQNVRHVLMKALNAPPPQKSLE